jgi:hypothetical protein
MSGDRNVRIERANKDYQGISFEMALILGEGLKLECFKQTTNIV